MKSNRFSTIAIGISMIVVWGGVSAQNSPSSKLGFPRVPIHKECELYNDFDQAICSGGCGKLGGTWIAYYLESKDADGNVVPGKGDCKGID